MALRSVAIIDLFTTNPVVRDPSIGAPTDPGSSLVPSRVRLSHRTLHASKVDPRRNQTRREKSIGSWEDYL